MPEGLPQSPNNEADVRALQAYLQMELKQLDSVFECSRLIHELLEVRRQDTRAVANARNSSATSPDESSREVETHGLADSEDAIADRLETLQKQVTGRFSQLKSDRSQVREMAIRHSPNATHPIPIRALIRDISGEHGDDLIDLRQQIVEKIDRIRALNTGSQVELAYGNDFYRRFLAGLSGEIDASDCYSAEGRVSQPTIGILRTNC